ncbi:MAG TPA: Rieske (2Fe-2S) protein [Polyangiales bacterium]|nr:Rieske (2Fe-2S) protein [Polyangiales bacterium]
MSATQLVAAGSLAELEAERWLVVRLAPDMSGRPREAVVVLDDEGIARAYLNQCRHLPIPLDGGSRQFLIGGQLHCGTHGARYRLNDGLCVLGPCRGASLFALPVEIIDARVFVRDELSR